uniref:Uncharacterized protein n=1 Tax=Lepeophtheirus salmonis TaxID=72036 RepID=A0A0K2T3F2_LEPSM
MNNLFFSCQYSLILFKENLKSKYSHNIYFVLLYSKITAVSILK